MGLDTTHDCWHGPYSAFARWRQWLNLFVMTERAENGDSKAKEIARMGATPEAIDLAWSEGLYDDQAIPINVLMSHSDCDGDIAASVCDPLADALEALLPQMPERALYEGMRPATQRFIDGLRRAAKANEPVIFA